MNDFIIAGIGGQGIITCSKLILQAALDKGYEVRSTETIGMAQRGGCVFSNVRVGKTIYSPFIPVGRADEIISMSLVEAFRYQKYLKPNGVIEAPDEHIKERTIKTRTDIEVKTYNLKTVWEKIGTKLNTNIIMLGVVFSDKGKYLISTEDIERVIKKQYCGEICEKNLEALYLGSNFTKGGRYCERCNIT